MYFIPSGTIDGYDTRVMAMQKQAADREVTTDLTRMNTFLKAEIVKGLTLNAHTAALDPKTAAKVLALTEKIVTRDQLTTLMITHNMRDALRYGNRLIMLHNGRVIIDVKGEEKQHFQIADLLDMFEKASGSEMASDRLLLG